jgi:DNA-binding transcriptional regulator YbjK
MSAAPRSSRKAVAASIPAEDRRTRIGDGALEVLAAEGARGLTHRAVDRRLELPDGSTSYYFRTRAALLRAAAERLIALDAIDIGTISQDLEGGADLVALWLAPERRTRSLARMELLLAAARDPALDFMRQARERFIAGVARAGAGSTAKESAARAIALVALVDGLILHGLVMGKMSRSDARHALMRSSTLLPTRRRGSTRSPSTSSP